MSQVERKEYAIFDCVQALCRLSERCHAVAKFAKLQDGWYEKAEQYAKEACDLMDGILKENNGEKHGQDQCVNN